jgi:hypothetical protein
MRRRSEGEKKEARWRRRRAGVSEGREESKDSGKGRR